MAAKEVECELRHPLDEAGVLLREEPLGDHEVEDRREYHRHQEHDHGEPLVGEHPDERAVVALDQPLEHLAALPEEAALFLGRSVLEEPRRHHRREGQRYEGRR